MTPWRRVSSGRRASTCLTRLLTLTAAWSISVPISNVTSTVVTPELVELDDIYIIPSTPVIAFSIGAATVCSSTKADAPGYTAVTCTTGGAISGYCAMGRARMAAKPANTITIEITNAKIGLSIKNRENMVIPSLRCQRLTQPAYQGKRSAPCHPR